MPTIVLSPQAGHDSCIVDYSAQQSQMHTMIVTGLTHALSLDWIGAAVATRDAWIEDYLQVVDDAIDHVGGRVSLIGDCQGGWLAAIYAAMHPERVNTLTLVAPSSSAAWSSSGGAGSISICSRCRYIASVAADHITPPDQVFAIANHASTPEELVRRDIVPGGHLGLFTGHQSLREHWPPMLEQVLRFSRRSIPGRVSPARR